MQLSTPLGQCSPLGQGLVTHRNIFVVTHMMFDSLFGIFSGHKKWVLSPRKYPKGSQHHYSSKVLLPYSMLADLDSLNFQPPFVFEVSDVGGILRTVCSVLDFALEEEEIHMPSWMFEHLDIESGASVVLTYTKLELGSGIRLQPHSSDFLEVENPRIELEKGLRNYPVLGYGNEILLYLTDIGDCRFTITEVVPEYAESVYLADVDLNVDFDEPMDYKEKLEENKTVIKYIEVAEDIDGIKVVRMKRVGLFLDWDNISNIPS